MVVRRQVLRQIAAGAAGCFSSAFSWGQGGKDNKALTTITVCQIADMSAAYQDVSKDFLTGSRAAWQEINARGGVRGRRIQHTAFETDGTPGGLRSALDSARDNPGCVALVGSAGDPLAQSVAQALSISNTPLAHIAPWLMTSAFDTDGRTVSVFASRAAQIEHALKSLSVMGITEVGAVYAGAAEWSLYKAEIERSCAALKLQPKHYPNVADLGSLGKRLAPGTPAVLLFIGGTPELVQFTQGLETQSRQRYVVAMADVNLQTVLQMGAARKTPVIATQVVPVTTASAPIVRAYRDALNKYFDEPPTALSLAGYISARAGFEILSNAEGAPTRASVLAAAQRQRTLNMSDYRIALQGPNRTSPYVTQSMLTADGRVVG